MINKLSLEVRQIQFHIASSILICFRPKIMNGFIHMRVILLLLELIQEQSQVVIPWDQRMLFMTDRLKIRSHQQYDDHKTRIEPHGED